MSYPAPQPSNGYIYTVGSDTGIVSYVPPLLTYFSDFPSSLSGAGLANVVVNFGATGLELAQNDAYAKQITGVTTATYSNSSTTEVLWTTQTAGSMVYVGSTGDIVINRTGWYDISANICFTGGATGHAAGTVLFTIAISSGTGTITTNLVGQDLVGTISCGCSCKAKLTIGQTIGCFVVNTSGGSITTAQLIPTQFSCKLIS